jgi:hypothetical protein
LKIVSGKSGSNSLAGAVKVINSKGHISIKTGSSNMAKSGQFTVATGTGSDGSGKIETVTGNSVSLDTGDVNIETGKSIISKRGSVLSFVVKGGGNNHGGSISVKAGGGKKAGSIALRAGAGSIGGEIEIRSGSSQATGGSLRMQTGVAQMSSGNVIVVSGKRSSNYATGSIGISTSSSYVSGTGSTNFLAGAGLSVSGSMHIRSYSSKYLPTSIFVEAGKSKYAHSGGSVRLFSGISKTLSSGHI